MQQHPLLVELRHSTWSSPDPDLASVEGEVFAAGRLNGRGLDGGGVGAAGRLGQAEGGDVLAWRKETKKSTKIKTMKKRKKHY